MSKIRLKSEAFKYLIDQLEEWMTTIGYSEQTVYSTPLYITRFLNYLEKKSKGNEIAEVSPIEAITKEAVTYYFEYLKTRKNL